jgi:uncharacterized membrane protein YhiD involved in acid resistance
MNKTTPICFLAIAAVACSTIACQDGRVTRLEQRVSNLEQRTQQLESQHNADANQESQRRENLRVCVANADAQYQSDIRSNGTKNGRDTVSVPVTVMVAMDRRKQQKIEECKLLYGTN